ncbi:SAM-dependent methyltransferase [Putridiphycobacter roseus]|uniref:SAM-dependent methyltransferase n=1 Tax=Putridiphycobacter roseus TaxID=2219161 RepID=A0A2W1MYF4_9FLAO|nr:methyltransferase domain-containing protein [Putridiphycobacter roseus]PZE16414.1 SAM-dependent methyltransferase [Putridiphycobacter roseus]
MFDKDPIGRAIQEFEKNNILEDIIVHSDLCEDDFMSVPYLFRSYEEMPPIEKKALDLCKGKILDVGAGAGCHSKYLSQQNMDVTAIDTSAGAIEHLLASNIHAINIDFHHLKNVKFDTVLMLMNGIGIAGKLDHLNQYLTHAKSLLNQNGQIICDSTDIQYLYEDEEGGTWIDLNSHYYGEMEFQMSYKDTNSDWFNWLYVDFETLTEAANKVGLKTENLIDSENGQYLVKLTML